MGKPKIRFEGYSEDWEQRKVSEIAIEKLSNGIMNNQVNDETGLRHINVINMYDSDKIHPEKLTFSGYDEDAVKKCNVELGDIFLTRSSLKPEGIAEANVLLDSGRFVYDDHLIRLKVDKENYDPFFVKLNLSERTFKRQFIVRAKTTAFTTIGQEDIAECSGLFPKREEQEKIGIYFSNLDHLITLHQRKYDETKTLKKYMLQKMFPQNGEKVPEIRFDGFTEDWEQRKLGEVCEIKDSARIPNSEWSESGIPYIRASDVTNENTDGVLFISQERYEFYKNRTGAPTKNDVLFNGGGEIGKSLLITDEKPIYVQGGAVLYARTSKSRELVGQYLKTYFETTNAKSYIDAASAGGTMRHFTLKPSQKMRILMPSVEEQEKIGGYFVNLDHLITLHQRKCNELKEIKKYMLQNMFV